MTSFPTDLNLHREFDNNINMKLGHYVYGLFDPKSNAPFYIGKAGGTSGRGNQRVLQHFEEARHSAEQRNASRKVAKIQEIWASGKPVDWKILRSGLKSEEEAFIVEATLIDAFTAAGFDLCNTSVGRRSKRNGVIDGDQVYAWAAPPFDPKIISPELCGRPIFCFPIGKTVTKMWKAGKPDYEEATRRAWSVSPHWRKVENAIAIGLVAGIGRCAFQIKGWEKATAAPMRWEILGEPLPEGMANELREKNYSDALAPCKGYMQFGNYVIFEAHPDDRRVQMLHGAKGKP